jgi:hypothetical protein
VRVVLYQGWTLFCYGFVQASCKYIKVYFTCSLCKSKLWGIISVGFDEIGQLLIIYFGFVGYLRGEKKGNTMKQCREFKEAYNSVRW